MRPGLFVPVTVVIAVLIVPAVARAECISPGFNPSGHFCDGCTYEGSMSLSKDQTCTRVYTGAGPSSQNRVALYDHRLIERARHGIAGLNGNTFAYAPAKGYVGKDEFIIEVLYRQDGKYGKFRVHWNVTVQ